MSKINKSSPPEEPSHLEQLANTAQTLNQLSDKLTKEVCDLERPLNKLNLGVSAKVVVQRWSSETEESGQVRLAYDKHSGKWGFMIEDIKEDSYGNEEYQSWAFKDAPRDLRLAAVEFIPPLLEELIQKSAELASEIRDKVAFTERLAVNFGPKVPPDLPMPRSSGSSKQDSQGGPKDVGVRHGDE